MQRDAGRITAEMPVRDADKPWKTDQLSVAAAAGPTATYRTRRSGRDGGHRPEAGFTAALGKVGAKKDSLHIAGNFT
jgi:hypothetical protein